MGILASEKKNLLWNEFSNRQGILMRESNVTRKRLKIPMAPPFIAPKVGLHYPRRFPEFGETYRLQNQNTFFPQVPKIARTSAYGCVSAYQFS